MKRFLFFLTTLMVVCGTSADKFNVGKLAYETTSDSTCQVLGYADGIFPVADSLVIPSVVENNGRQYKVTSIGKRAFSGCDFSYVDISENVITIDDYAFNGCRELSTLNLPKNLRTIGDFAFGQVVSSSGKLETITIPESVRTIGEGAFICTNLSKVDILGNAEVGAVAFSSCGRLKRVEGYPKTIGTRAFVYCDSLSQMAFAHVESISDEAFYGCHHVNFITLQNSDNIIFGKETFKDCTVRKLIWYDNNTPKVVDFYGNLQSLFVGNVDNKAEEIENKIKEIKSIDGWKDIPKIYSFWDLISAYSSLSNAIDRVETYTLGDKLGQYHMSERTKAFFARGKETLETYYEGVDEIKEIVNSLLPDSLINIPTHGKFLRMKNNEGKYVTSYNNEDDSRVAYSATRDDATIFCYFGGMYEDGINAFGELLSYKTAYYLADKKGMLVNQTSVPKNTDPSLPCQLHGSYMTAGKYLIGFGFTAYLREDASIGNFDKYTVNDSLLAYDYTLEEVDTIPLTISRYGMSTFYSPVALQIPDGVTVYTCDLSKSGNSIVLTPLSGVIPANTGVLLEGVPNATYGFVVSESDESVSSCLDGNLANSSVSQEVYTLQMVDGKLGFYKYTGVTLHGFRSYLNIKSSSRGFNLVKDDDVISGINDAVETTDSAPMYDLNGNRLASPQKNQIFIRNGKKQIFR